MRRKPCQSITLSIYILYRYSSYKYGWMESHKLLFGKQKINHKMLTKNNLLSSFLTQANAHESRCLTKLIYLTKRTKKEVNK